MTHQLGDGPIDPKLQDVMVALAKGVDEILNGDAKGADRKVGFVMLTFPYGPIDGRCNFISNGADRRDLVTLFKEMIARFEGQPHISGNA
ncbi:hypothetical protein MIC97_16625 [Aquamicrobium sp. NLF2-7]|uniref:hypothetical protein n=1 Tax=Aquamicrobium sp. NLF2-7 TaxID=2918753 RepID=UPI001EFB3E34|nr:hypothetical protein [Aquamicrobium sp. NLF2-7]MCG8273125.1 hypothetical protein [Aquamicrobium sp. NLF2-7]